MKKNFSFIFLGLTHGFIDDFVKQKELIEEIKPEFVLSEQMENKSLINEEDYSVFLENKKHSFITSFGEVQKLVNLCSNSSIKLIGIDFENFGFSGEFIKKIKSGEEFSKEEEKKIERTVLERENYQYNKIRGFEKKSMKPILVFLGSWHLRNDSPIIKNIKNSKVVFPADEDKNLMIEPKDCKIQYLSRELK